LLNTLVESVRLGRPEHPLDRPAETSPGSQILPGRHHVRSGPV